MEVHAGKSLSEYYKIGSADIYVDTSKSSTEDLFKEKTKSLSGNKYILSTLQDGVSEYTRRGVPILAKYGTSTLGGTPDLTLSAGAYRLRYSNKVLYCKKNSDDWEGIHSYSQEVEGGPKIWIWMSAGGGCGGIGYNSGKIRCGGGGGGAGGAILFPYRLIPEQEYYLTIGTGGYLIVEGSGISKKNASDSTFKKGAVNLIRASRGLNGENASSTSGGNGGSGGSAYISSSAITTINAVIMVGGSGGDGGTNLGDGTAGTNAENGYNPISYSLPPIDYRQPLELYFTETQTGGMIETQWISKSLLGGGGGGSGFDVGGATATGGNYSFNSNGSITGSGGEQGGGGGAGQPFATEKSQLGDATNDFNNSWCEGGDGCAHIWYS